MRDEKFLRELLEAETENAALVALESRGLVKLDKFRQRWRYVGKLPNNQAVVLNQQSSAAAALVEKYTNGADSILLRRCKAAGIDPRSKAAPQSMVEAVDQFFGDLDAKTHDQIRALADELLVVYATGRKDRPSLSLYDSGEGQLARNFPNTFCSLISAGEEGSYKRGVPFVQGQFNMGGTGVLQFCSEKRKLQLILSRVPNDIVKSGEDNEWAYTLFCFFESEAAWCYLVGEDGHVMTAGHEAMALLPRAVVPKAKEVLAPRVRKVESGTLIKMYDYQAPRSNVCGELFRKVEEYLLRPPLPMRIVECRPEYAANVMAVTAWDCMARWAKKKKLEEDFEEGASFAIDLANGETVPGEIRVFKMGETNSEDDAPHTGVRALINGQSHAKRDSQFFRKKAVDKEHVAGSILVTLMCEAGLSKSSRNQLFMSNRETFREGTLLNELLDRLQTELHDHEALKVLNEKRYAEKVKNSIKDEDGIKALEELLSTDPNLANLFGTFNAGTVAARTATNGTGGSAEGDAMPFKGVDFPTFFHRGKDKATVANVEIPRGEAVRVGFSTDVKNNYFTRRKPPRGEIKVEGALQATRRLFNGRLTFTCRADKNAVEGSTVSDIATITDKRGSGPFVLTINARIVAPRPKADEDEKKKPERKEKVQVGPSQPNVKEKDLGPDQPPVKIEKHPETGRLQIILNNTCSLLDNARKLRPKSEAPAVEFVFKYGLALAVMGLLDNERGTEAWKEDDSACRDRIEHMAIGIARVIVPLCLSLPKNLPKPRN